MIKKSVFENDLIWGMQRELQAQDKKLAMDQLPQAADYLQAALEILESNGLTRHADQIVDILTKIAQMANPLRKNLDYGSIDHQEAKSKPHKPKNPAKIHDSHTQGLTPDKMVENLKHHGIVFNLADDGQVNDLLDLDVNDADLEVTDPQAEKDFEEES
jgi:hypothetical protein